VLSWSSLTFSVVIEGCQDFLDLQQRRIGIGVVEGDHRDPAVKLETCKPRRSLLAARDGDGSAE
jgi:hypothetical protein